MNGKYTLLAVTTLALLAGCNRGATNNSAGTNNSATGNSATATAPVAPPAAAGGAVDQNALLGHWGMAGNCSQTLSFNGDGSATATGEENPVRWSMEGSTLVTTEANDPPQRSTVAVSGDVLSLTAQNGQTMQLTRCAAAATGAEAEGEAGEASEGDPETK